ncbi:hypothetical protein KOW79_015225 [Hemibagrus wyckioides]|uniref:Uncharacterized protein n=1 Tax=Hemibagrus wyckioides TaxID=337641 RepID=A0A9D3SEI4_9TELE|nr:hypothetical protein KOW79_015225 [Hemibagrus wyckioides]
MPSIKVLPHPNIGVSREDSPPFVIQQLERARVALLSRVRWSFGASLEARLKRTTLKTFGGSLQRTSASA